MTDKEKEQSATALEGYTVEDPDVPAASASDPAMTEARSASKSPPPVVPIATKPNVPNEKSVVSDVTSSPPTFPGSRPRNEAEITQDEPKDSQIVALKAIFPDYDDAILQSVLESVDGDQDHAIDLLLGMSDPDFKNVAPRQVQQSHMTQEELDEQFARQLMLEEQQQTQQWRQQPRPQRRSARMQGQQQPQLQQTSSPPTSSKDTMTELQEQVSKYAEIGKRNFGAFMSKVKAKIQEFDKPDESGAGSEATPTWGRAGSSSYYQPNAIDQSQPPRTNYQPYHGNRVQDLPTNTMTNTAISQPAAFYNPNSGPQSISPTQYPSTNSPENMLPQQPIAVEGYRVDAIPSNLGAAPASDAAAASQSTTAAATSGSVFSTSVPPRGPSPANPIDGGKLGLLPKRPISLIRDPPQTQPQVQRRNSDDDDLEYAESPFDEDRK